MPLNFVLDCPQCGETYWSKFPEGTCEFCQVNLALRPTSIGLPGVLKEQGFPLKIKLSDKESAAKEIASRIWPDEEVAPFDPFSSWMDFGAMVNAFTKFKPADILILMGLITCEEEK